MIAAAVVLLLVWLGQRSAEGDLEPPAAAAVGPPSPAGEAAPGAAAAPPPPARAPGQAAPPAAKPRRAVAPPPPAGGSERALVESVKEWVGAWSERRVEDYLASYSRSFVPEGGANRRLWEAQRRERLSSARFVRVAITGLETELLGGGSARATFLQYYRSDGYSDTVRKTLDLVWEDGRWRIQRERSADAR